VVIVYRSRLFAAAHSRAACAGSSETVSRNFEPAIPDIVIRRLPLYVRTLRGLQADEVANVSSDQLAELIGVTAAQIRRDLSYFGKFGKQGKGYDTFHLEQSISQILQLDRNWDVALAGFGALGHAIAHYHGFGPSSFHVAAIFDRNPDQIGQQVRDVTILSDGCIAAETARLSVQIGIIAVPATNAQEVANAMIAGGVRSLLNYAPVVLKTPPNILVREIDPIWTLQSMTYYLDGGRQERS
jgi:redox-sensing transcriptional repressor